MIISRLLEKSIAADSKCMHFRRIVGSIVGSHTAFTRWHVSHLENKRSARLISLARYPISHNSVK